MTYDLINKRVQRKSPMHLMVLADDSGSMAGAASQAATKAIQTWLDELYAAVKAMPGYFKVSVVAYGTTATVVTEAQDVTEIDASGLVLQGRSGMTNMAAALSLARQILERTPTKAEDCPPFVFLFSDGRPTNDRGDEGAAPQHAALHEAHRLKSLPLPCGNPFVVTLGFGEAIDALMAQLATSTNGPNGTVVPLYHRIHSAQQLIKLLPAIGTPRVGKDSNLLSMVESMVPKER